ncbi:MAG: hypothetical protein ACRD8Z_01865 [Nitrososphaeraceae archaeon]
MSQQQQVLKQELTISQILRVYGKQFRQITEQYSDGRNGRCAIGVILSYFGWDGKPGSDLTPSIKAALPALTKTGLDDEFSIIELNDTGWSFDEIANYLDSLNKF